jgi:hypothetical protein
MRDPHIPIACTLSRRQFPKRKELVQRLREEATERRELPNGIRLCFEPESDRVTKLAKLVDLERACCPLLTFQIYAPAAGPIWLEVTGPAAAQQIIHELVPERAPTDGES